MAEYDLDALGWFQFERIVQALLKAAVSPVVESWSGSGDHGRDAYYEGPLAFPDPATLSDGPFLFQMKFVATANAAGARPWPSLSSAISAEIERIETRRDDGTWTDPKHYVMVTNAPLTPKNRNLIRHALAARMPDATIHSWGAQDLDGLLDNHPGLRMSYPQILGIRDLDVLLRGAVHADILNRSRIEHVLASELATIFVPTTAYYTARDTLTRANFAVLSGPPEMGKTAIARMLALVRLSQGWEAYECTEPSQFFSMHQPDRPQLFVADDAFGSTEYSPSRAEEWARDMERILSQTDKRHWVIFTSRPAPLSEALRVLHFQGRSRRFPAPAQVRVDASYLSMPEKAQILYRHAKAAGLTDDLRHFVRRHASTIVYNPNFTPLRIHRLVQDELLVLADLPAESRGAALEAAVQRGLQQPTQAMRTSFNALPISHRRMLLAMVDASAGGTSRTDLLLAAERHQAQSETMSPEEILASLDEHFLRVTRLGRR